MEADKSKIDTANISIIVTQTLCVAVLIILFGLMIGLFFTDIDSAIILRIFQPALQTIIGGFIGFLTAKLGK